MVSAKHLSLASPLFAAMLGPGFQEGDALEENGYAEIELPDDDPKAFQTAMLIVHGQTRSIHWELNIREFFELAILTDKYALHESVESMTWHWATGFGLAILSGTPEEQIALVISSWIFKETYVFAAATSRLLSRYHFLIDEDWFEDLPMPPKIISKYFQLFSHSSNSLFSDL